MPDSDDAVKILLRLMKALMAENARFLELINLTGAGMFPEIPVGERDRENATEKFEAYVAALKFLRKRGDLD